MMWAGWHRPLPISGPRLRPAMDSSTTLMATAVMAFLLVITACVWAAASALTGHSISQSESTATILIPSGINSRGASLDSALEFLTEQKNVEWVRILTDEQIEGPLRRWLGNQTPDFLVPFPTVIFLYTKEGPSSLTTVIDQLALQTPGSIGWQNDTLEEKFVKFSQTIGLYARCGLFLIVGAMTLLIIAATRSALVMQRDLISVMHELGASDDYIARRFAKPLLASCFMSVLVGALFSLPVIFAFGMRSSTDAVKGVIGVFPVDLAYSLPPTAIFLLPMVLSLIIAMILYAIIKLTVRTLLLRLP